MVAAKQRATDPHLAVVQQLRAAPLLNSGGREFLGQILVGEVLGRVSTRSVRVAVVHIVLSGGCRSAAFYSTMLMSRVLVREW